MGDWIVGDKHRNTSKAKDLHKMVKAALAEKPPVFQHGDSYFDVTRRDFHGTDSMDHVEMTMTERFRVGTEGGALRVVVGSITKSIDVPVWSGYDVDPALVKQILLERMLPDFFQVTEDAVAKETTE